ATRRAFEANEIKEGISRNCDRKSLKNLAVVDRQWSEAALDVLWYEVTNLEDLLRPLGPVTSTSREIQVVVHPVRPKRTNNTILTRMPRLTKLTLNVEPDVKYIPSLTSTIEGLPFLQSLTISPFSNMSEIVSCLSGLQNLKELHVLSRNQLIISSPFSLHNSSSPYFSALERITLSCTYQIASGFLCREIPSLMAIRVVTSIREQPSNVRSLLCTISASCPRVTQISLEIKHNAINLSALRAPLSPESALTLEVLSPILQRSSIRSFSVQHPLPFDVGLGEVKTIASSWPHLKSLSLACDPYLVEQPTSCKLGLDAFLPFIRYCPNIEELGLFINAKSSAIPSNEEIDALPLTFTKLQILSVGTSAIQYEEAIAQFLSFICTQGCVIKQGANWFEQSGQHFGESAKKWMEVDRLLRNLLAVRTWYERRYERKLVSEIRKVRETLYDQPK
ncbi:hypothetical protein K435DRAFT_703199, partial [Dendrothele bispora CBS 962.96]